MNTSRRGSTIEQELTGLGGRLGFRNNDGSFWRAALVHFSLLAIFGVWLPLEKGADFLIPILLGSYLCLGVIFAAPAAAVPFPTHLAIRSQVPMRIAVCVGYGFAMSAAMLITGVVCVYSAHRIFVGPDLAAVGKCLLFGIVLSLAVTSAVVWATIHFSPAAGKMLTRVTFAGLLVVFFHWSYWLPDVALLGSAILAACTGICLLVWMWSWKGQRPDLRGNL